MTLEMDYDIEEIMKEEYERRDRLLQQYTDRRKSLIDFYELALKYTRHSKRIHVLNQRMKNHKHIIKNYYGKS